MRELRVVLQSIRIMNDRDPAMAPLGFAEAGRGYAAADNRLTLDVRVEAPDDDLVEQGRLPEGRHYRPYSLSSIRVEEVVFEGEVTGIESAGG